MLRPDHFIPFKAEKFYWATKNIDSLSFRLYTRLTYFFLKRIIMKYFDEGLDKAYWREMGWLDTKSPFSKKRNNKKC